MFNECQLVFNLRQDLGWHTAGVTLESTAFSQRTQMAAGRGARRYELLRVFITQLVQRKTAALGPHHRLRQRLRREQSLQPQNRTQMRFGIGLQLPAALCHGFLQARGRQHILQRFARSPVHQHTACCHQGQTGFFMHLLQTRQHLVLAAQMQALHQQTRTLTAPGL